MASQFKGPNGNVVSGDNSAAFGSTNTVSGDNSFATGTSNQVTATLAAALGSSNQVQGGNSVALGGGNVIQFNANNGLAYGSGNTIQGSVQSAIAGGTGSVAGGTNAVALGKSCQAAENSFAAGDTNAAGVPSSFASGIQASTHWRGSRAHCSGFPTGGSERQLHEIILSGVVPQLLPTPADTTVELLFGAPGDFVHTLVLDPSSSYFIEMQAVFRGIIGGVDPAEMLCISQKFAVNGFLTPAPAPPDFTPDAVIAASTTPEIFGTAGAVAAGWNITATIDDASADPFPFKKFTLTATNGPGGLDSYFTVAATLRITQVINDGAVP